MTIKNTDKNVSAENHEVVADVTYANNGILTIVRKNLYSDTEVENKNVDLSDHKLKLRVLEDEAELRALETSDDEMDTKDRQSYVFLVPFENSGEEGVYREYIWVEDEHDVNGGEFEVIGSTKTDLEPYFKKSDIANNVTTTEEGKALDARQGKALSDGLTNMSNSFGQALTSISNNLNQRITDLYNTLYNNFIQKSDIANNVTTTEEGKVLDARQGKVLSDGLTGISQALTSINNSLNQRITDLTNTLYNNFLQKSSTPGLVKNDGNIDTKQYIEKSSTSGLVKNDGSIDTKQYIEKSSTSGFVKNDGSIQAKISVNYITLGSNYESWQLSIGDPISNFFSKAFQKINSLQSNKEDLSNKVTTISSSSTNTQYPSAKLLYDQLQLKQNSASLATVATSGDYEDLNSLPINHIDDGDITSQPANDMFYITSTEQIEVPTPSFITLNVDNSFTGADNLVMNITLSSNQTGTLKDTSGNTLTYGDCKGLGTILVYVLSDRDFILFSPNKIGFNTKTLTINYTDGTSENIDFYIK